VPVFKDDLVADVRSAYLMLFINEPAPIKIQDAEVFWTNKFAKAQFWENAISASISGNYDLLRRLFENFSNFK
jgi:hypothetical protein